ncbi:hypothetical protein LDENG_00165010 [Lucifuga dentata]|nr:hypothetical protein LDENG_00165010 [Lucifuga dentata]
MKSFLFLLSILGCCAADDILPEPEVDAILGKNVTFRTLADLKDGFLVITWMFNGGSQLVPVITLTSDGENVDAGYEGRVSVARENGFLTLGPLTSEDSGDYSLNIVNHKGQTKTGEVKLRVLEPVSGVIITSNMPEAIEHNSTVILTCTAKGSFLKFTWLKEATPITNGGRFSLKEAKTTGTLTISSVLRSDLIGPIYCVAANKLETEKSSAFNLTVHYGPDKVTISPLLPPKFLKTGSDFNLLCSAESSPPAAISWYHNGKQLAAPGPQLALKNIQEKEGGNYSCHAHNAKTLHTYPSAVVSLTVQEAISGVSVIGPSTPLIAGNHTANLSCQAMAGSVTMTSWLKDNTPLTPSDRVVISNDMKSVMIKMVQKEDNGEFKCELASAISRDSASYKMVVNFGPESVTVTGSTKVKMNDLVSLQCSAISVPAATYTWKINGTVTDVTTAEYAIATATFKNSGMYTCEAHNAVTGKTSSYSHKLVVKEKGTLSNGAIAGIVIGVLFALGLIIGVIVWCRQKVP